MKYNLRLILTLILFLTFFFYLQGPHSNALARSNNSNTLFKVKPGDTVYSILKRHGFNDNQLSAAISQSRLPVNYVLSDKDLYRAQKNEKTGRFEIKFYDKNRPIAYVFWRKGSSLPNSRSGVTAGAERQSVNFDVKVASASGRVRGSLIENIAQAIGNELVAYRFMDAFLLDYNLPRLLRRNAPFALTYEKLYEQGQFVRFGEVLRAEIEINNKKIVRTYKPLRSGGIFVNPQDNYSSRPFYAPVNYIRFSSLFQPHRFHPIQKFRRSHLGVDFEIEAGAPVMAISDGRVLRTGRNRAAGNFIVLEHPNGYQSFYNHMQKLESLRPNQIVAAGALLGQVGCTGFCTKPHLHFALKRKGNFVNPISLIRNHSFNQQ